MLMAEDYGFWEGRGSLMIHLTRISSSIVAVIQIPQLCIPENCLLCKWLIFWIHCSTQAFSPYITADTPLLYRWTFYNFEVIHFLGQPLVYWCFSTLRLHQQHGPGSQQGMPFYLSSTLTPIRQLIFLPFFITPFTCEHICPNVWS